MQEQGIYHQQQRSEINTRIDCRGQLRQEDGIYDVRLRRGQNVTVKSKPKGTRRDAQLTAL